MLVITMAPLFIGLDRWLLQWKQGKETEDLLKFLQGPVLTQHVVWTLATWCFALLLCQRSREWKGKWDYLQTLLIFWAMEFFFGAGLVISEFLYAVGSWPAMLCWLLVALVIASSMCGLHGRQ
ncbi:unnamed protein product [Effrenium voratum]|nr:unnamed protein product [Effrenium voratum]